MATTTTAFEIEIVDFPPSERGLCAAPAYRLRQNYLAGIADPAAHAIALANPEHVDALARNGKTASFEAITSAGGGPVVTPAGLSFAGAGRAVYPGVDLTGDFTMVWMGKTNAANSAWQLLLSGETNADVSHWSFSRAATGGFWTANGITHSRKAGGVDDFVWTPANAMLATDPDMLIAVGKVGGGGQIPTAWTWKLVGGVWTPALVAQDFNAQLLNGDALGAGSKTCLGMFQNATDGLVGNVFMAGLFAAKLSTAQLNAAVAAKTTAAFKALSPTWLVDASDKLTNDLSGNGKHRSALSGAGDASLTQFGGGVWTFG